MHRFRSFSLVAALATAPLLLHCSSSDTQSAAPSSSAGAGSYRGLLTGTSETGVLDVTIAATSHTTSLRLMSTGSGPMTASGTISIVHGQRITLTGSFDAATGTLTLTGTTGSGAYSLTGKATGANFEGTYTSPNGNGNFSLLPALSGSAVTLYCGTYDGDSSGAWNLAVDGSGTAIGSHCDDSKCGGLSGKLAGTKLTLSDPLDPSTVATGTATGAAVTGTWSGASSSSGTWQGSTAACGVVAEPTDSGAGGATGTGGASGTGGTNGSGGATAILDAGTGATPVEAGAPTLTTIATGLTDAFGVSADDAFAYFFTSTEIHRCPVTGCGVGDTGEKMAGPLSVPSSVLTTGTSLFWTQGFQQIATCAVTASPGCTASTFLDVGASTYPAHLRVHGTLLYWISEAGSARHVQVCPVAGCTTGYPKTILDSANSAALSGMAISGLAVTDANLFILSYTGGLTRYTMTDAETVDAASGAQAASTPFAAGDLDVNGTSLVWGSLNDGKVQTCPAPSCTPVTDYLTGLTSPAALGVSSKGLFVAERGTMQGQNTVPGTGQIRAVLR